MLRTYVAKINALSEQSKAVLQVLSAPNDAAARSDISHWTKPNSA
jgi:hypothetical protein